MNRSFAAAGVPVLLCALGSLGQAAEPGLPLDFRPDRLIRQLAHGSLATRDAAVRGLLASGVTALPAIEQAIPTAGGETAFRLPLIAGAIALAETRRRLESAPAAPPAGTVAGPFSVALHRSRPLGGTGVQIWLRLRWQAGLQPVLLRLPLASVVAEGPLGEAVPVQSRRGAVEPLLSSRSDWVDLPIRLETPPAGLSGIDSLRGTIECWLPGFDHRFVLPLPGAVAGQSVVSTTGLGGVAVDCTGWSIEPPDTNGPRRIQIRLAAKYSEPSEAFASHRDWLAGRQPNLLLPDGSSVKATGHRVAARHRQGLTVETSFPVTQLQPASGLRVAWRLPLGVHRLRFDFRLSRGAFVKPADEPR